MVRLVLFTVLVIVLAVAVWRFLEGLVQGASRPRRGPPDRGVQMVRDPVCGMFLLPERAVTLAERGHQVHFCSDACRDKYRARSA